MTNQVQDRQTDRGTSQDIDRKVAALKAQVNDSMRIVKGYSLVNGITPVKNRK